MYKMPHKLKKIEKEREREGGRKKRMVNANR